MSCTIDEIVDELDKFIRWLSYKKQAEETIMMTADEIAGELFLELVKGFQYYEDRDLPKEQMIALIKRMLDNRISELIYKYFVTPRKFGNDYVPMHELIDRSDQDNGDSGLHIKTDVIVEAHVTVAANPEYIVASMERVQQTLDMISPTAQAVLNAIINGNDLLQMNLQLAGDRAAYVYKNGGTVKLRPWHVADSLGMDEEAVKSAFKEITVAYREVCNE